MIFWIKTKDSKEHPIKFDQSVIDLFVSREGVKANDVSKFLSSFSQWPMDRVHRFWQLAFMRGHRKQNMEFQYDDLDDFIEWMSEDETIWAQVMKVFTDSNSEQKKTAVKVPQAKR